MTNDIVGRFAIIIAPFTSSLGNRRRFSFAKITASTVYRISVLYKCVKIGRDFKRLICNKSRGMRNNVLNVHNCL